MIKKLSLLASKFDNLLKSNLLNFEQVAFLKNQMGVYVIYEGEHVLYVGKTNKFHIRFGTDLKHESTHTLVRKLIKSERFKDRHEVVHFLKNSCQFRIELCNSNREAEALEGIVIYILDPDLNKR